MVDPNKILNEVIADFLRENYDKIIAEVKKRAVSRLEESAKDQGETSVEQTPSR